MMLELRGRRRFQIKRSRLCVSLGVLCALLVPAASATAQPSSEHPFEIVPGSFRVTASNLQAGAHADLITTFDFAHNQAGQTYNDVRTTIVNLPAGFLGNNTAVPTCTDAQLATGEATECPTDSQVGTITLDLAPFGPYAPPLRDRFPVYNMEANVGVAATLGFHAFSVIQILPVSVRPGDAGLTVTSPSITDFGEPRAILFTVWGVPGAAAHDVQRGQLCSAIFGEPFSEPECRGGGNKYDRPVKPFLFNPTICSKEAFTATLESDSWQEPQRFLKASTEMAPLTGCERLPFDPTLEAQPTTTSAESPTGLGVSIVVPQTTEDPETLTTSHLQDSKVTLPEGMTINPSAGSGLGACTPQQLEAETASSPLGAGCPVESKIGSVEIETPLLSEKLYGSVFIATPFDNPFDSLLSLYVVAKAPERGVITKVAGKLEPDPITGRLVTTFENTPQAPFGKFTLKFRPGPTAPLVSPPACGSYAVQAELAPYSSPLQPRLLSSVPFTLSSGVGAGPCPAGGVPPFKPQVVAGTQDNAAGSYSPFYLRIVREDGEQEITKFTTILPPGLTGNLSGIPFCSEAAIEAARGATGTQELESPSCPAASEIGHTLVEVGVGSVLAQAPGKVYLAGPYHGSALSVVSVTASKVGPFDLGTVVIRFALSINPITAQVEINGAGSDPIPHIIKGIVVHVRDIRAYINREKFILNPTTCDRSSISETITGTGANPANPADQMTVGASAPFQAADCQNLKFQPTFRVSTSGRTSRSNGASLSVKLTYPANSLGSQANIKSVKVDLPKQLPSRLTTLQKACVDSVFNANPANCPAASKVGTAKAITPLIPVPLEGPAYFVSHGGAKFPELIIVLQGYGVTIDLHGETFISKAGITSSTFRSVPDEPVTSFELTLPQGPNSALAAPGNLCSVTRTVLVKRRVKVRSKGHTRTITRKVRKTVAGSLTMPTSFTAQNGMVVKQNTPIAVTGCARHKAKKGKASGRGKRHGTKRGKG